MKVNTRHADPDYVLVLLAGLIIVAYLMAPFRVSPFTRTHVAAECCGEQETDPLIHAEHSSILRVAHMQASLAQ